MFGTWKYDPETDEVQNIRQAFDPVTARSSQHQACDRCHEKKLKCSGEEGGCQRCIANNLSCEYTRSGSRGSRRRGKHRHRSGDSPAFDDSPASSQAGTPQAWPSSHTSSPAGPSSRRHGGHHHHVPASSPLPDLPSTQGDMQDHILDQLDFSMLSPSDGFDMSSLSTDYDRDSSVFMPMSTATSIPTSYMTHAPLPSTSNAYHYQGAQGHPDYMMSQWTQPPDAQGYTATSSAMPGDMMGPDQGYYDPEYHHPQSQRQSRRHHHHDQRYYDRRH